jgi:hypothetical protein
LKGGVEGFILFHVPVIPFFLYGFLLLSRNDPLGLVFSDILALLGIFTFTIHMYFLRKGRKEFSTAASLSILGLILVLSVIQLIIGIAG